MAGYNRANKTGRPINPDDQRAMHNARSPLATRSAIPDALTHEGGAAFSRDARTELFLLAVSHLNEGTFYEGTDERAKRFRSLVHKVAASDPVWTFQMIRWLRTGANMRSASIAAAAEAVRAWHERTSEERQWWLNGLSGHVLSGDARGRGRGLPRTLVNRVLQRADEPGELLAYWVANYGKAIPKPIKRGVSDAVARLYTEYNVLKYDTSTRGGGGGYRFADVLELCHPSAKPSAQWLQRQFGQSQFLLMDKEERASHIEAEHQRRRTLFRHIIDRRHDRPMENFAEQLSDLPMIVRNRTLRQEIAAGNVQLLLDPANLKAAGMTWEDALSLGGSKLPKNKLWEALIEADAVGYMALLRNLRNLDEAGVSREVARRVADRLADPDAVANSRQFPFRFYSAYQSVANTRWHEPLDQALTLSVRNIPLMRGRTLVLVDTSGSMSWSRVSERSQRSPAEVAALFGVTLANRAAQRDAKESGSRVDLVGFADGQFEHGVRTGGSLLPELARFIRRIGEAGHGTDISGAVASKFNGHDRVIIISDMQTMSGGRFSGYTRHGGRTVDQLVPDSVPIYGFNLLGYTNGAMPSGQPGVNRHEIGGGLTDATFRMIPLLEAGQEGVWPWEPVTGVTVEVDLDSPSQPRGPEGGWRAADEQAGADRDQPA